MELLLRPVTRSGAAPLVVDVGARSGMLDLPQSYTRAARLIGFEPNPEEYRRLLDGDTDPIRAGYEPPRFMSEHYFDCALWNESGQESLTLTSGPGTPTLMGNADETTTRRMFRAGETRSFFDTALQPLGVASVEVRTLDELIAKADTIDYLKLDVEGAELKVLEGATELLSERRILVIRSEFTVVPYYETHPLLGDQHLFLHNAGFRMIDIQDSVSRYSRAPTRIAPSNDRRLLQSGDAVYVLDPERVDIQPLDLQRMAAVVMALGYHSFGTSLMRDADLVPAETINDIETVLAEVPWRKKVLHMWQTFPSKLQNLASKVIEATGVR